MRRFGTCNNPPPSFKEWNDFYNKFVSLMSYIPTSTIYASLLSIDDDDNRLMCDHDDTPQPTLDDDSFDVSFKQLHQVVRNLAKLNCHFLQFLETLSTPSPCPKPSHNSLDIPQQLENLPAPQMDCIPKGIFSWVLPPAPNPAAGTFFPCESPWPPQPTMKIIPYKKKLKPTFAHCGT